LRTTWSQNLEEAVNRQKTILRFSAVATVVLLFSACDGGSGSRSGAVGQKFNLSGQWTGSLTEVGGSSHLPSSFTISDNVGVVTGTMTISGHTCFNHGNLTGTSSAMPINSKGDNPLTQDQENSNQGTGSLTLTSTEASKGIESISIASAGSGYTSPPGISFTAPDDTLGSKPTATAVIQDGAIKAIVVNSPGTGYRFAPGITFSGGGGTGAAATATLSSVTNSIIFTISGDSSNIQGHYSGTWNGASAACRIGTQGTISLTRA